MGTIAFQITSLTSVYSIVYPDADQRKHQSSASLAFVRGIHRSPVASYAENVSIWWRHHEVLILPRYSSVLHWSTNAINHQIVNQVWWHRIYNMMTPSNGNIFRFTDPLWGGSIGHRWIPLSQASNAELCCFLWSAPEQTAEQTIGMLVIWDAMAFIITSL